MNQTLKIYLAGKMSGLSFEKMNSWRKELKTRLRSAADISGYRLQVINPVEFYNFEDKRHQTEEEAEDYDLAHVTTSNIIIVNLEGLNSSDGTKLELHDASYHNKIPVIAFGSHNLYEALHPWIKRDITRTEENMGAVIRYIQDFYMF